MNESEDFVVRHLVDQGFECEAYSKQELRNGKTPDRRVYRNNEFVFFLEIKEIAEDQWKDGERNDPIYNRLTDDIYKAVEQFDAVNPNRKYPNVLAMVNKDLMCGYLDLIGVLTGNLLLEGGGKAPVYLKFSEGRIRDKKTRIDLFLWFDSRKANQVLFSKADPHHFTFLCELFKIDPDSISSIGSK